MNDQPLAGLKTLVTGGSSGIGRAITCAFADAGAEVVVNYRSHRQEAERVTTEIRKRGGIAFPMQADISQPEQCERLFEAAEKEMGCVDVVVANAGIQQDAAFCDMTLEQWNKVINVNLTGQFTCAQSAVRCFRRQQRNDSDSPARGKIIFTSSVHQEIPWAGHVNYATAKGGLKLLMETMAQELAPEKIRVNAIAPAQLKPPSTKMPGKTLKPKPTCLSLSLMGE